MKVKTKHTNAEIELAVWQLFAIIIAAIACLFAIVPLISRYRSNQCDTIVIENTLEPPADDYHARYVRDVHPREQCDVIPPVCSVTTTGTTVSTIAPVTTTRSTVSTVLVTRPIITPLTTTQRTTTPDPWANVTRPYNSWRLPPFAKPIDYTLNIACSNCYNSTSDLSAITFDGQVNIGISILNPTDFLVLHAKNLNITQASITSGGTGTAIITYLQDDEMVYLYFGPATIAVGEINLQIDYTGLINQKDQTGFYRELFWKSTGDIS
jgi:hypothetical protein